MNVLGMETPVRKRCYSEISSSSSSRHVNKRFRSNSLASASPKVVRFNSSHHEEDPDTVMESDVPDSPIAQRKSAPPLSVSFTSAQPLTPLSNLNNPFAKLNLKASAQKKNLSTPIVVKSSTDGSKSVKKIARRTPGSAKANKSMPFRTRAFTTG